MAHRLSQAQCTDRRAPLERRHLPGALPLSPSQQALWIATEVRGRLPGGPTALALEVSGPLDPGALEQALTVLCRRHDLLHSAFTTEQGRPVRYLLDPAPFALLQEDGAGLDSAAQAAWAARQAAASLDLEHPPLLRAALLHTAPGRAILTLSAHPLVLDGLGLERLLDSLGLLYQDPHALDQVPAPAFLDVQLAEARRAASCRVQDEAYWLRRLQGLPTGRSPEALRSGGPAASLDWTLSRDEAARLRAMSHARRLPLCVPLAAAWTEALARQGELDQAPDCLALSGRRGAVLAVLPAPLATVLPLVPLEGENLLEQTALALRGMLDHGALGQHGLDMLLRAHGLEPLRPRSILEVGYGPRPCLDIPEISTRHLPLPARPAAGLCLGVRCHGKAISCRLEGAGPWAAAGRLAAVRESFAALLDQADRLPRRAVPARLRVRPRARRRVPAGFSPGTLPRRAASAPPGEEDRIARVPLPLAAPDRRGLVEFRDERRLPLSALWSAAMAVLVSRLCHAPDVVLAPDLPLRLPAHELVLELITRISLLLDQDPCQADLVPVAGVFAGPGPDPADLPPVALFLAGDGKDGEPVLACREASVPLPPDDLARRLVMLALAMAQRPGAMLAELDMTLPRERDFLERVQGREQRPGPGVLELFSSQARQRPGHPAVEQGGRTLSYGELDRRSSRLARLLREEGLAPGAVAALMLPRCPDLIVAILGVLKAGAAYLPVDPALPGPRRDHVLDNAGAALVLTHGDTPLPGRRCLRMDTAVLPAASLSPAGPPSPDSTAYLIYTSGSTGLPKGVVISHAALSAFVHAAGAVYRVGERDRFLQFCSISFDASVEEIFISLCHGATLVLREAGMTASLNHFIQRCGDLGITTMSLPTAFWHLFTEALADAPPPASLRQVIIGGESARADAARAWHRLTRGRIRLLNTYGPSECTVAVTAGELGADTADPAPIGRPLEGTFLHVLNHHFQPQPPGLAGDLYCGGPQLADGYLGLPLRTARSFLQVRLPGAGAPWRLYHTGDRVLWRDDGQLAFLDRQDRQVKIRGFRVELAEVEAALRAHPRVRAAAVKALRCAAGPLRIVAYVEADGPAEGLERVLRADMPRRLPAHALPAIYTVMEALPMTVSGKIDYPALPVPEAGASGKDCQQGESKERIRALWREILQVQDLPGDVSFFDLGGDSLAMLALVARMEKALGRNLPAQALFQNPTIQGMAQVVDSGAGREARSLAPVRPQGEGPPLFLDATNDFARSFAEITDNSLPLHVFTLLDIQEPDGTVRSFTIPGRARQFVEELRQVQPRGPYFLAGYCLGGKVMYETACQLEEAGEEVALLLLIDTMFQARPVPLRQRDWRLFFRSLGWGYLLHVLARRRRMLAMYLARRFQAPLGWLRRVAGLPPSTTLLVDRINRVLDPIDAAGVTPRYQGPLVAFLSNEYHWKHRIDYQAYTRGSVEVYCVGGAHELMFAGQNAQEFKKILNACLGRYRGTEPRAERG